MLHERDILVDRLNYQLKQGGLMADLYDKTTDDQLRRNEEEMGGDMAPGANPDPNLENPDDDIMREDFYAS